jgi:hypothetical protein
VAVWATKMVFKVKERDMKSLFLALMLTAILDGSALAAQPNNNNNNNRNNHNSSNNNNNNNNNNVRQVPEASTFVLLGSGLVGLVIWFKRKPGNRK